ncbi:MAG: metallopeptidase family protein [Anaerolineales bacterium]|nr:metallopeptidase family protein [Anaerolineales bacterium]
MDRQEFEHLVVETLDSLPEDIRQLLDNVEVTVADHPSSNDLQSAGLRPGQLLFGLYQGVPLTRRTSHYGMVLPDKITIYQKPIEQVRRTPSAVRAQVRRTVLHELAHHFGLSDDRLRELGVY